MGASLCLVFAAAAQVSDLQEKREKDLKMPEIIQAMGLEKGSKVADIGAGEGYYEVPISKVVGADGIVYAEDINPGSIKRIRERADELHLENVRAIQGEPDNPKLPESTLDAVFTVITYHEFADYQAMLRHVKAALKPGGRFVVVDMTPHKTLTRPRADQVKNHVLAPDLALDEIRAAGFALVSRDNHFIDRPDEESTRWMMVFRKPAGR